MKKIIGIIAAVAMAASVFAMDFSGALKADGDLFNMSFADGSKPTMLKMGRGAGGFYWGTRFQTAFYGDKCGAQFAIGGESWAWFDAASVWVQPIDMLKITLIKADDKLYEGFGDTFDALPDSGGNAYKKIISTDGAWQFTLTPIDNLTINLTLASEWIKNGAIGDTGLSVKYADEGIGTIGFMFKADKGTEAVAKADEVALTLNNAPWNKPIGYAPVDLDDDGVAETMIPVYSTKTEYKPAVTEAKAAKNFTKLHFGVGYNNKFGDLDMFANVVLDLNTDSDTNGDSALQTVKLGAQAAYAKDALSVKGYVYYALNTVGLKGWNDLSADVKTTKKNAGFKPAAAYNDLWLAVQLNYAMDAFTPYIAVSTTDLLLLKDQPLDVIVKPGVSFNIGAASCDVAAKITIATGKENGKDRKGNISVPFSVTVAF